MSIGQRVVMLDGSFGIIIGMQGCVARVCYLTPDERLSYISKNHLVSQLQLAPNFDQRHFSQHNSAA